MYLCCAWRLRRAFVCCRLRATSLPLFYGTQTKLNYIYGIQSVKNRDAITKRINLKRRNFIQSLGIGGGAIMTAPARALSATAFSSGPKKDREIKADLVIAGAGMGGCAAAIAALRNGLRVIMTEETDWIGGQLTQQGLSCPDEHQWIESFGATRSYRDLRTAIRAYYQTYYPLTSSAKNNLKLNPGNGSVSRLCHEPRVALTVLNNLLLPCLSSGKLVLLLNHKIIHADTDRDQVKALTARCSSSGRDTVLHGTYFLDATELGELLPLTKTEYVTGAESRKETRELHAPEKANPADNQAYTYCFAMDYLPGESHIIEKPEKYDYWSKLIPELTPAWPGRLLSLFYSSPATLQARELGFDPTGKPTGQMLNLFNYRRIIDKNNFDPGFYKGDITVVNWPQNDYFLHNQKHTDEKKKFFAGIFSAFKQFDFG